MRRLLITVLTSFMIFAMLITTGCSNAAKELAVQKRWEAYYSAKMAQINKPQQKQFDVNVADDGKFQGVTIYAIAPEVKVDAPKKEYHPAWQIGGNILHAFVPYLGVIGTAKVVGDSMVDLAKTTQGPVTTTTYTNSNNTSGGDYAGGDMANAVATDAYNQAGGDFAIGDMANSANTAGQDYAGADMANTVSGDTVGADYYNAGNDIGTSADTDGSITSGGDYAGNDYYPDSSDNSNNSTTTDDNSVTDTVP